MLREELQIHMTEITGCLNSITDEYSGHTPSIFFVGFLLGEIHTRINEITKSLEEEGCQKSC